MTTNSPSKYGFSRVKPFQVLSKARLDSGVHVAISPNMVLVPELSIARAEKIQVRMDGMYGEAEVVKWPTFRVNGWEHLECVPIHPDWREARSFQSWKSDIMKAYKPEFEAVLWRNLGEADYTSKDELDLRVGTIAPEIIKAIEDASKHILGLAKRTRAKYFGDAAGPKIDDDHSWNGGALAIITHLTNRVHASVMKLANFRERRMDLVVTFRDAQRFLLETMGWVIYHTEVRDKMSNAPTDRPVHPYPIRGSFVWQPEDLTRYHYAGIPVWIVCGIDQLPEYAAVEKEQELTKLEKYFDKRAWSEAVWTKDFPVPIAHTFCRTKEQRELPQDEEALKRESNELARDAEAPMWVSLYHDRTIKARLGETGFYLSTEAIPSAPSAAASTSTTPSSSTTTASSRCRFSPFPISKSWKKVEKRFPIAEYPLPIVAPWDGIVKEVNEQWVEMTTPTAGRSERMLPSPAIISKHNSGSACAAWLAFRPLWMSRIVNKKEEGFDREGWQKLLRQREKPLVPKDVNQDSSRVQRQEDRQAKIRRIVDLLNDMQIAEKWKEEGESLWNGHVITEAKYAELFAAGSPIIKEIAYEITELNFRFDVLALDSQQLRHKYQNIPNFAFDRQTKFMKIFHNEMIVDKQGIRAPPIWSLKALPRREYTAKLAEFMQVWPSWPANLLAPLDNFDGELLEKMEHEYFREYTYKFIEVFHRLPSVPCVRPESVSVWYQEYQDRMEVEAASQSVAQSE